MTERIPDPIAGQDVLPWAGKVTLRLNALGDKVGAQSRNERLHETHLPQPFEVRWDGTLNDWAGGWKIYLPAGDLVVLPKGVTIDPTGDLSALGGDHPGWYLVPAAALAVDASGTLYLNITLGDSPSAEFSSSASAADENEIAVEICATSVGTNPAKHEVDQFVTSAIVLGGAGAAAGEEDRGCFRIEEIWADPGEGGDRVLQHTFGNRYFRIGDYIQQCFDSPAIETMLSNGNTVAALQIAYSASGGGGLYTASIVGFADVAALIAASADRTRQLMPLYKFAAVSPGSSPTVTVEVDFRNAPMSQEFELPII